jgi:hypothetical protein
LVNLFKFVRLNFLEIVGGEDKEREEMAGVEISEEVCGLAMNL